MVIIPGINLRTVAFQVQTCQSVLLQWWSREPLHSVMQLRFACETWWQCHRNLRVAFEGIPMSLAREGERIGKIRSKINSYDDCWGIWHESRKCPFDHDWRFGNERVVSRKLTNQQRIERRDVSTGLLELFESDSGLLNRVITD